MRPLLRRRPFLYSQTGVPARYSTANDTRKATMALPRQNGNTPKSTVPQSPVTVPTSHGSNSDALIANACAVKQNERDGTHVPSETAPPHELNLKTELQLGIVAVLLLAIGLGIYCSPALRNQEDCLLQYVAEHRSPAWVFLALILDVIGGPLGLTVAAFAYIIVLWHRRSLDTTRLYGTAAALIGTTAITEVLKRWLQRPRPGVADHPLLHLTTGSMPSGHSTIASAFFALLALNLYARLTSRAHCATVWSRLALGILIFLVISIPWSRVYIAAHHPSDVITGLGFGLGLASAISAWQKWHNHR